MTIIRPPKMLAIGDIPKTKLFVAGGISNCPNWQAEIEKELDNEDLLIINPRRPNFSMNTDDPESRKQIQWEHFYIQLSDIVIFWFPCETVCPITLYELGSALKTKKKLVIGTHPNYSRRFDILVQAEMEGHSGIIYDNLTDMISFIKHAII